MDWDEVKGITKFSPCDVPEDMESNKAIPLYIRAKNVLARGSMTPSQLAAELGMLSEREPLKDTLKKLNDNLYVHNSLFAKIGDVWGLRSTEEGD